jgi:hypothetical protein
MTIDNGANAGASKLYVRHKSSRFSHSLRIRCPAALCFAVDQAAERGLTTSSEYIRRAVMNDVGSSYGYSSGKFNIGSTPTNLVTNGL